MYRRALLRTAGSLGPAALLAGCSGTDGGDERTPTRSARETAPREPSDATGTTHAAVGGLALGDPTAYVVAPLFVVAATVRNTGERETDALAYEYDLALSGNEAGGSRDGGTEVATDEDPELAPGESIRVVVREPVDGDPSAVTGFDLGVTCEPYSEGVYCDS